MLKRIFAGIIATALMLSVTACGAPSTNPPSTVTPSSDVGQSVAPAPKELTKVTLSTQPATAAMPFYIAKEKGYFEEQGLDAEIITYVSGAPQMEAMTSNAWRVGSSGIAAMVTGVVSYDATCLAFSTWDQATQNVYVRPDSPIVAAGTGHITAAPKFYGNVEDYRGIDIICNKGTVSYLTLLACLEKLGLKETDVNIIHMEFAAGFQAFAAGQADAIVLAGNFAAKSDAAGWKCVATAEDAGLFIPSPILATQDSITDSPEVTQRITNALLKAMIWQNDHLEETGKMFYDMCVEEGTASTEEVAQNLINQKRVPTIDEIESMLKLDANGLNGFQQHLSNMMGFYIQQGTFTDAEKEKVVASFNPIYLTEAVRLYRDGKL